MFLSRSSGVANPVLAQFFFALFSLSSHNRFAATLVDEIYLHHRLNLATMIGAARPAFTQKQCFDASTQIVGLLEGLSIFAGVNMKHSLDRTSIVQLAQTAVAKLLE
jgi:hypothetical protein